MREYFLGVLQNLDKLTGMKQYEKLLQTQDYKTEIKTLLDILCRVCDYYPFIPDENKQSIINDAILSDPEFIGLNAKFISKSLNSRAEHFRQASDTVTISSDALTGEERDKRLAEWMNAVNQAEAVMTQPAKSDYSFIQGYKPTDGREYKSKTSIEDLLNHARHVEYIKQNYDVRTGKPLPTWISEDEFNKNYDANLAGL